ncbi:PREDICTED: ATP-binding cassette sub-family C member Sur [Vollenhovia emeryi]|uniref:ATP-binding cassette sub-family C member Sur n=1 Tax=Vollenhovia emeryi TaxID=411798 RepID=UPI0005F5344E|nr:PREDICTED: ATP-binding cassette sub-family C member Sur [Vollenhovia emeryi]XP_011881730.1 PREDICTED: ATP-binding cassette sub-family C member Sur [Vollenhovia emeryi]XP_011881731.1 PREDICTED: ATP-binding cassette sub-family C member Sur [Vollenhovia emeryi]XP_011881732.1 PREDICTED: ATP-binding cassette sub-family C member Sur [Vollenhovia emeryi]XP_011881733.1 PREDICTED: ATP-binding cassette sub-family C member Sur [Vollenhovia emeryi]XP_011881734.1 PREDICTED: ATP-binding cassette sub-fami
MDLCKRHKFLHVLPTLAKQIVWSWRAGNGTVFQVPRNDLHSPAGCLIELTNVSVALLTILVATVLIFKYRCSAVGKLSKSLLPLHTSRTLLCILLLLILSLELYESILTLISLSSTLTMIAVLFCWIVHRETETRDGFGTAVSGGGFTIIGLSRAWKFLYLCRFGLSIQHVRVATTGITATCCGLLAIIDSYTLYRMMQKSRRYTVKEPDNARNSYVHSTSPFLSRITFHWVIDLLLRGYHTPLELHDLGQLPVEETTRNQFERFREIYETERLRCRGRKLSLWRCFWRRTWLTFAAGSVLKLFGDAMTLVGPMTIPKIISYASSLQNGTVASENFPLKEAMTFSQILRNGYFLGIVVFLTTILQSTLKQASTHVLCVGGIRLRTALQALIYDKALRLSTWSISEEEKPSDKSKEQQCHQQVADVGTLTNLMAEDAYNVMSFFWTVHYIWAVPLKITAIIFLLYSKLGISAIIGVTCCILIVTPMQLLLGKRMSENSKSIAERSDARLRLLNEILQGIRLIKLHAWENLFEDRIRRTRDQELKLLRKDSVYWALINFLTHAFSVLVTLFTFGIYFWLEERNLDAGNVFASLALFSQLTVPLFIFPVIVPIIINAMISTTRLEEFLQLPETVNILPVSNDRNSMANMSKANSYIDNNVEAVNSVATFGSLDNIVEDEEDLRSSILREFDLPIDSSVDTVFEKDPEVPESVLKVTPSTFTWGSDENTLTVNALNFPRGQLTIIVGKTGSGKTSLLLALLGEIQSTSGSVEWTKGLKIAYVARQPWLQNTTLRDNILFGSAYQSRRYRDVLQACALESDVDILPGRDLTRIGERGINLSGGQKQRVTIARALYSDADVILLDNPLSALDQHVGQQIFDYGVRKLLLRSGRTVIMVTHKLELLPAAHQIIVMDGCRVRAVGTKSSIENTDSGLAAEWRIADSRREDENRFHKTAKDRWSLIKLVYRIGMNKTRRHVSDGSWISDVHVNPPTFVPLRLRRTTLSGSRYWSHALTDLSVSTEEWDTAKKRSRGHRNIVRLTSLQAQKRPPPIFRQNSTPTILENRHVPPRKRNNTYDSGQPSGVLKQFFSARYTDEVATSKDKNNVLSRLMPGSNKITQDQHRQLPAKRLLSMESRTTVEMDDMEETLNDEDVDGQGALEADDKSGMVTRMIWMEYPKAAGWLPGLVYAVAALAFQILRVYTDFWLSEWMEESIHSPANTVSYFMVYIIISVGSILLSILYNVSGQWAGTRARRKLHQEAVAGLLGAPVSFFEYNHIGKVLSRFSADMSVIDKKMATAIKRLTSFALLCGSVMIINIIISPWFLLAVVPISCAYYALQKFYRRGARQLQCLDGSTRGPVVAYFSETLSGLPTLRAFKQEDRFTREMMRRLDINTNAFLILNTSSRWFGIALDYLGAVIVAVAISTALLSAELYPSRVTPKLVGLAINYTLLVPILNWVVKFSAEIELYMGSVARICAYRNAQPEKLHENGLRVANDWPNRGEIVFENVSLRYDADRNPVITDLSLKILAGQKLGICGRTGSGKSSTVMALFHLIEISQGRVLLDGIDIRQVPLRLLRSRLSAIPQDAIMFSGTIRENLDPFSEHEEQEIWRALELSQIKDVVASYPEGLSFEVREGGENFSAGQLQLLCMARAILQRSSIVVLDEATSALDIATEKSLLKAAAVAFEDRTVITIAHRAAALLDCDRIIVFDEGRIVEEGSPADLMQRQNGIFSAMIKAVEQNGEQR